MTVYSATFLVTGTGLFVKIGVSTFGMAVSGI